MGTARRWALAAAGLLVVAAVLAASFIGYVRSTETRRWEEMRQWCEQKAREARARDPRRPVLRGVAVEGNAWDDYNQALDSLSGAKEDLRAAYALFENTSNADATKVREIVKARAPALQALRRGVQRTTARRHVDWESAPDSDPLHHRFAYLVVCQARFLMEDGAAHEAMTLLLDTARYGEDVAFNGTQFDGLLAAAIFRSVQDELMRFLSSGKLSREHCRQLAAELEILDREFPREADAYALEPMTTGFEYLQTPSIPELLKKIGITKPEGPAAATWRYGFSERLVLVDAFQSGVDWAARMKEAVDKPWKEALEIQERAAERWTANPLLREYRVIQKTLANAGPPRDSIRECRARLRLLQGLAHYRVHGLFPLLYDPYGDKICNRLTETHLELWSVGGDGVDDGGIGEWNHWKSRDIVLKVQRGAVQEK